MPLDPVGDKVLWMCGGRDHKFAVDGVSRQVHTVGEIEPCKLEVKAQAPLRKFLALGELTRVCDGFVGELKNSIEKLNGIYERSDAMLTVYPGEGARFANHVDNTTADGRRLTCVMYLNPGWTVEEGGAIRVQCYSGERRDVYPLAGRLALFYSAEIQHEVLPTFGNRHAMTYWYYDRTERERATLAARESGAAGMAERAGVEAQVEAKGFIAALMGGDEVGEDGGSAPAIAELDALRERSRRLTDAALGIVSSITGAPSKESFREGFELLTTEDLKSMRALFRRMGLQ